MVAPDSAYIKMRHDGASMKSNENLFDYRTDFVSPLPNCEQGKWRKKTDRCPRGDLNPTTLDTSLVCHYHVSRGQPQRLSPLDTERLR